MVLNKCECGKLQGLINQLQVSENLNVKLLAELSDAKRALHRHHVVIEPECKFCLSKEAK